MDAATSGSTGTSGHPYPWARWLGKELKDLPYMDHIEFTLKVTANLLEYKRKIQATSTQAPATSTQAPAMPIQAPVLVNPIYYI